MGELCAVVWELSCGIRLCALLEDGCSSRGGAYWFASCEWMGRTWWEDLWQEGNSRGCAMCWFGLLCSDRGPTCASRMSLLSKMVRDLPTWLAALWPNTDTRRAWNRIKRQKQNPVCGHGWQYSFAWEGDSLIFPGLWSLRVLIIADLWSSPVLTHAISVVCQDGFFFGGRISAEFLGCESNAFLEVVGLCLSPAVSLRLVCIQEIPLRCGHVVGLCKGWDKAG